MMPVLSGTEVLSLIRHDPRLRKLPVLVVSGGGDARRLAMKCGADACLEKPVDAQALLQTTRELANHPRSERQ
jgi:CheY-like chemotaxis protein